MAGSVHTMSNWIKSAIKHPGAFTKQAKSAGESVGAFAQEHKHDSGKTGRRARLAISLRRLSHAASK